MAKELSAQDVFVGDAPMQRLLDDLEDFFPVVNPQPTDDLAMIMFRAGQRSVVEYIRSTQQNDV